MTLARAIPVLLVFAALLDPSPAAAQDIASHVLFEEATLLARYRYTETGAHVRTANQLEDKIAFRARVKADRKGRLSLELGALTGPTLTGSWNTTGVGVAPRAFTLSVRQFYAAVAPLGGVEADVGSFYAVRGESTEITSYDNDAYFTGERIAIRRPRQLFFDAVWLSRAYLGDTTTPNVFDRLSHLSRSNYVQALVQKTFSHRVATSLDWTNAPGGATWRAGIRLPVVDAKTSVRVESYLRAKDDRSGIGISLDRAFRGFGATLGFASIDGRYPPNNGDRYRTGARVFAGANVPLPEAFAASVFYTQALKEPYAVPVGHRFEVLLTYNVLAAVERGRHERAARGGAPSRMVLE